MAKRVVLPIILLSLCAGVRAQVRIGVEGGPDYPRVLNLLQGYNGTADY